MLTSDSPLVAATVEPSVKVFRYGQSFEKLCYSIGERWIFTPSCGAAGKA